MLIDLADDELIIDHFAGGGGASTGIEQAIGRSPDIAINHDPEALAMHAANHPNTLHLCENVWAVDIEALVSGRRVGLAWFSPDCKHFSKAKGGKPVEKRIRGLAWVVLRWAGIARPRVIFLENVEEFQTWGPVLPDGQPCKRRRGMTFKRWVTQLRNLGYSVEWRELRACDYGAPTIRKRLFLIARCDGKPIVWPSPTHAAKQDLFCSPWRTAAECIDWSIPCPSIFGRKKPLAEATLRRIALGIKRYVLEAAEPFIVSLTHHGGERVESIRDPFKTVTGANRGEKALITPYVSTYYGAKRDGDARGAELRVPLATQPTENRHALVSPVLIGAGGSEYQGKPRPVNAPMKTQTAENHSALVSAFLAKHYGGVIGSEMQEPVSTVTATDHNSLVTSHLVKLRGKNVGSGSNEPIHTVSAGGFHIGEVRAFLLKYFGTDQDPRLDQPMHTVTSKHRFGLVTVHGEEYQIVDIGMRMLTPRELFRAQGFPDGYKIDPDFKGKPLTKTAQVRMCGNSVAPPPAAAIVRAQFVTTAEEMAA